MPFENFVWSSRRETCDELCHFLLNTQPKETPIDSRDDAIEISWSRRSAASLLVECVDAQCKETILEIVFTETEDRWVRRYLLRALNASPKPLSDSKFQSIVDLNENAFNAIEEGPRWKLSDDYFVELLKAVKTDSQVDIAMAFFLSLSPRRRSQIIRSEFNQWRWPREQNKHLKRLTDVLLEHWFRHDRPVVKESVAVSVAAHYLDRDEMRKLLLESCERGSIQHIPSDQLTQLLSYPEFQTLKKSNPALWGALLERMKDDPWTQAELKYLELDSAEERCKRAMEEVYRIDATLRKMKESGAQAQGNPKDSDGAENAELIQQCRRERLVAFNIIIGNSDDTRHLESLLNRPKLDSKFYNRVELWFWRKAEARATLWLCEEMEDRESTKGLMILSQISGHPNPDHETLLRQAYENKHACVRYLGLNGLAWLDLDDIVDLAQKAIRGEDIFLQLRAHGILAKSSEPESIRFLSTKANDLTAPLIERAEALRWLAHADPEQHFPILAENVLRDDAHCDGYHQPVKEECAYGIARVGTHEALSYLVRALFCKVSNPLDGAIHQYIKKILAWNSGEDREETVNHSSRPRCPDALPGRPQLSLYPNVWRNGWPWYPGYFA